MFERCRKLHTSLNLKTGIFTVPFGTILGHIVCKDRVCVDLVKVVEIVHMELLRNIKQLKSTLAHSGYYQRFSRNYASITAPLEKLLKRTKEFIWNEDC